MHDRCPLPIPRTFWKEHLLVLQVMRCMYTLEAAGTRFKNFPEGAFGNSPAGDEMHVNFESSVAWCDSDKKQLQSCDEMLHQQVWPSTSCQHASMHSARIQTVTGPQIPQAHLLSQWFWAAAAVK